MTAPALIESNRMFFQKLLPRSYILFILLPVYWLVNMSFKSNDEILSAFTLWPADFTLANYVTLDPQEADRMNTAWRDPYRSECDDYRREFPRPSVGWR